MNIIDGWLVVTMNVIDDWLVVTMNVIDGWLVVTMNVIDGWLVVTMNVIDDLEVPSAAGQPRPGSSTQRLVRQKVGRSPRQQVCNKEVNFREF